MTWGRCASGFAHAENCVPLMAVVPLVRSAMERHAADAEVVRNFAGCVRFLTAEDGTQPPL